MADLSLKPAQFIRLDLFPATIINSTNPEAVLLTDQDARIIITNDMVYILLEGQPGRPVIHYEDYLEEFTGNNKEGYVVITAIGNRFLVKRAASCGCGNTLRGYFPYPGVPFIKNN